MTNEEIVAGFRSIVQRWIEELREWNSQSLTKHPFVVSHGDHDAAATEKHPMPPEHGVPRSG